MPICAPGNAASISLMQESRTVIHRIDRFVEFGTLENKGMRDQERAVLAEIRFVSIRFPVRFFNELFAAEKIFKTVRGIAFKRICGFFRLSFSSQTSAPQDAHLRTSPFLVQPSMTVSFFKKEFLPQWGQLYSSPGFMPAPPFLFHAMR